MSSIIRKMNKKEDIHASAIQELQRKGYYVIVRDINAENFNQRFSVFQCTIESGFKTVVTDSKGECIALQG